MISQRVDAQLVEKGRDQHRAFLLDGERAGEPVHPDADLAGQDAAQGRVEKGRDAEQQHANADAAPGDGKEFDEEDEKRSAGRADE